MTEKILVVEDDESIANILKEHFEKENFNVVWASTGIEGLDEFKQNSYNLVILDIMMPEMDGFTLCKNIRWINEDIPILILSAKNEYIDKINGLKIGADDYITKPFSLLEISARVQAHLRRERRKNGIIDIGKILEYKKGLKILIEKKQIMMNEEEIQFTIKEFELLLIMAKNNDVVFSKSELYQNIWKCTDIDGNNTVTVHIKAIREKLKDSSKKPTYIQTIWGTGYKFIGELKK